MISDCKLLPRWRGWALKDVTWSNVLLLCAHLIFSKRAKTRCVMFQILISSCATSPHHPVASTFRHPPPLFFFFLCHCNTLSSSSTYNLKLLVTGIHGLSSLQFYPLVVNRGLHAYTQPHGIIVGPWLCLTSCSWTFSVPLTPRIEASFVLVITRIDQ